MFRLRIVMLSLCLFASNSALSQALGEPEDSKLFLGDGFDLLRGNLPAAPTCLEFTSASETSTGGVTEYFAEEQRTVTQMAKALGVSAAARATGAIWSLEGKASYLSESIYDSQTVHLVVRLRVKGPQSRVTTV